MGHLSTIDIQLYYHTYLLFLDSLDEIFEGDKPPNYSDVITQLLKQLDSAVSITQKCLTKDIFERNPRLACNCCNFICAYVVMSHS